MSPDPLALECFACWLCFAQHKNFLNQTLVNYATESIFGPLTIKHLPTAMILVLHKFQFASYSTKHFISYLIEVRYGTAQM